MTYISNICEPKEVLDALLQQTVGSAIIKSKHHSVASIEGENDTSILKKGSNCKIPLPIGNTDPII